MSTSYRSVSMKKIVSFYYLNYPDTLPDDPSNAYSEVYAEIGDENATGNQFDATFSFNVCTIEYARNTIINGENKFLSLPSLIIVERFEDDIIEKAIESILDDIEEYGRKIGE